jgi:hypothetical protein
MWNWILIAISVVVLLWLVRHTVRRAGSLNERIEQYKEECDKAGPTDPYVELSKLLSERKKGSKD